MFKSPMSKLVSLAVGFALASGNPATVSAQPTGTLTGTVSVEGVGLAGIAVTLSGAATAMTESGAGGQFAFTNLLPGGYTVSVTTSPDQFVPNPTQSFTLSPGAAVVQDFSVRQIRYLTVSVNTDPDSASVRVSPDPLIIRSGDSLEWRLEDGLRGPFAVQFEPISPLTYRRLRTREGENVLAGRVRWGVFPGSYSYFIAVEIGGVIYTEDPELIDENGDNPPPGDTIRGGSGVG